jgi:hypothetical protein
MVRLGQFRVSSIEMVARYSTDCSVLCPNSVGVKGFETGFIRLDFLNIMAEQVAASIYTPQ